MKNLIKMNELVATITGSMEAKENCRRITGEFYLIGDVTKEDSGQCYKINDKFYKYNTGYIVYDHRLKQYVIKNNSNLINGIVGIDEKGECILGYFSTDATVNIVNVEFPDGNIYKCIDAVVLKNSQYKENLRSGHFTHRLSTRAVDFINPGVVDARYKRDLPYDSRGQMGALMDYHKNIYNPEINNAVKKYGGLTSDLTFGVEFETVKGKIPKNLCDQLGLIPLRDGSIGGLEYATIPLQGLKGVQTLINSVSELKKYTTYNTDCSIHFHIGNLPRTEEFFVALFKTLCSLENQMYALGPLYKKYNFGVKRKHYTRPYPLGETMFQFDKKIDSSNIKENFSILYKYLSMGQKYSDVDSKLENVTYHPSDPHGTSKWNIRSRYHWVNLIPLLFGNKQTVEFRLHTPTYDTTKIMNYLILCTSIINFVKHNTKKILKNPDIINGLVPHDIISSVAGQLPDSTGNFNYFADNTFEYFRSRKDFFYRQSQQGIINPDEDKFRCRQPIKWAGSNTDTELVLGTIKRGNSNAYGEIEEEFVNGGGGPFDPAAALQRMRRGMAVGNDGFIG